MARSRLIKPAELELDPPEDVRLDEFDKVEWFDAARRARPWYSWERFEQDWTEAMAKKRARLRALELH